MWNSQLAAFLLLAPLSIVRPVQGVVAEVVAIVGCFVVMALLDESEPTLYHDTPGGRVVTLMFGFNPIDAQLLEGKIQHCRHGLTHVADTPEFPPQPVTERANEPQAAITLTRFAQRQADAAEQLMMMALCEGEDHRTLALPIVGMVGDPALGQTGWIGVRERGTAIGDGLIVGEQVHAACVRQRKWPQTQTRCDEFGLRHEHLASKGLAPSLPHSGVAGEISCGNQPPQQAFSLGLEGFIPGFGLPWFVDVDRIAGFAEATDPLPVEPVEDPPVGEIPLGIVGMSLIVDVVQPLLVEDKVGRIVVDMPARELQLLGHGQDRPEVAIVQPLLDDEIDDESSGDVLLGQAVGFDAVSEQLGMLDLRVLQSLVTAQLKLQGLGKRNGLLPGRAVTFEDQLLGQIGVCVLRGRPSIEIGDSRLATAQLANRIVPLPREPERLLC